MNNSSFQSLISVLFFVAFGLFSCRNEDPTIAKIRVFNEEGVAISNAMVRLYPTPTIPEHGAIIIDDTLYTDGAGYATFNYTDEFNLGQAGFAVLDIEARSPENVLFGEGIIKIEPEKVSEETVILQ